MRLTNRILIILVLILLCSVKNGFCNSAKEISDISGTEFTVNRRARAIWVWAMSPQILLDHRKRDDFFAFLEASHGDPKAKIDTAFMAFGLGPIQENWPELPAFLGEAHSRGLEVHFLDGAPDWALDSAEGESEADKILEAVLQYNQSQSDSFRFDGVQYDVEPYLLAVPLSWAISSERRSIWNQYITNLTDWQHQVDSHNASSGDNITFGVAIPHWWKSLEAETGVFHKPVQRIVDYVAVLSYTTKISNGQFQVLDLIRNELEYADAISKPDSVYVGQETIEISWKEFVPRSFSKYMYILTTSFFGETIEMLEQQVSKIYETYASKASFAGVAIHYYEDIANGETAYRKLRQVDGKFPEIVFPKLAHRDVFTSNTEIFGLWDFDLQDLISSVNGVHSLVKIGDGRASFAEITPGDFVLKFPDKSQPALGLTMEGANLPKTSALTWQMWIRPEDGESLAYIPVLFIGDIDLGISWLLKNDNNSFSLRFYYSGNPLTAQFVGLNADNDALFDGGWHHIAFTYDGSTQSLSLFLDGRLVSFTVNKNLPKEIAKKLPIQLFSARSQFDKHNNPLSNPNCSIDDLEDSSCVVDENSAQFAHNRFPRDWKRLTRFSGSVDRIRVDLELISGKGLGFYTDIFERVDSDHDQLNDNWERDYFGHLDASAEEDSDGDGFSNGQEFLRGTDPTKYVVTLESGWNLVSIARAPVDHSVEAIFGHIDGVISSVVWFWENKQFQIAREIEPTKGYWVFYSGSEPIDVEIQKE